MKIITNESLLRRNRRLGQIFMWGGMGALLAGMVVSVKMPEKSGLSLAGLIVGFISSQMGFYFMNRWGRRPRPDELLNQALKGLDLKYTLFHYQTPASHLLVGPAGIWVLSPHYQNGTITFSKGRWHQKGGNLYLKFFAQQGLGRPDLEIGYEVEKVQDHLRKNLPEEKIPPIQAALIFANEKVQIQIDPDETPPAETLHLSKLKDFIRKTTKNKPLSAEKAVEIQKIFTPGK